YSRAGRAGKCRGNLKLMVLAISKENNYNKVYYEYYTAMSSHCCRFMGQVSVSGRLHWPLH
ncbi:MAG: hypothetical protein ACK2UQ_15950, partial [Anaerolineae bacterium]